MSNPGPSTTATVNTVQLNVPADGLVIGGATSALVGFYGLTPVAQPTSYAAITDSSGGTAAATNGILTLTSSYNSAILGNAIATLAAAINGINAAGVSLGVWAY